MKNILIKIISIILIFVLASSLLLALSQNKAYATNFSEDINSIDDSKYPGIKAMLQSLKSQYPNWNFKIMYTGLNWNDVITNEYTGHGVSPKNLVQYTSGYKGAWICPICGENRPYDNGTWRCASEQAIAYMMDPRNSLNVSDIFQFEELSNVNANIDSIRNMTNGTFLAGYEQSIINTANECNVNPYYIVARVIQEQGRQGSELVSGKSGYYNAFNIGASGANSAEIIANGIAYAQKKGWTTLEASIKGGIESVSKNYINQGQNTLYLQKFNVTSNSTYAHQYQQNLMAAQSEGATLRNAYIDINSLAGPHTFIIPVYENMPATACARPDGSQGATVTSDLVRVNVTSTLRIRNEPNGSQTIGTLYSNEIVTRLEKATTKVNGTYWDKVMKSSGVIGYAARETYDGETPYKLYLVPIVENTSPGTDSGSNSGEAGNAGNDTNTNKPSNPTTTEKVRINEEAKQILVEPGVIAQDILEAFGGTAKIVKADGSFLDNEQSIIGTNYVVEDKYTVIKKADVTGDGHVNSADLLMVQKYLLGVNKLEGTLYQSADTTGDNQINSADLLVIQKYLLGVCNIEV